jgi:mono/diheme cytochrome c family protein
MFKQSSKFKFAALLLAVALGLNSQGVASAEQAAAPAAEAGDPSPFPPGPNVMLVKRTCSQCHAPNVIVTQTFDEDSARKIYQKMLGESPDTERGKKIVEYLATVLGDKSDKQPTPSSSASVDLAAEPVHSPSGCDPH